MKSHYITREGWLALDRELKYLWKEERPKITQSASEAAALGDRTENAEYIYGKKRLREIDRRVRYLSKRLDELNIIEPHIQQQGKVFFGAWVTVVDNNDQQHIFRIVGSDEFDPSKSWISIDSPVGRALIGKTVGEDVSITVPNGLVTYTILGINYQSPYSSDPE